MTIQKILLNFEPSKENLLPLLQEVNARFGFVSKENTYKISDYFKVSPSRIYGIITASEILKAQKEAAIEIGVCTGAHCKLKGAEKIIKEIENYFKIKIDRSSSSRFKLISLSCPGECQGGPIVKINGTYFEKVKPYNIDDILRNYT